MIHSSSLAEIRNSTSALGGKHGFCNGRNPRNPFFYWSLALEDRFLVQHGILTGPDKVKIPERVRAMDKDDYDAFTSNLQSDSRHDSVAKSIDWPDFLSRHDMVWDRVPHRWEVAPYTGNGNVGFLFYQAKEDARNVISIYAGRHDDYDHRLPHDGQQMLWIYRSRLPLGHFNLTSNGKITATDLRLDLWNAELTGQITTSKGRYAVRGFAHSTHDILFFEAEAEGGESIAVSWHPYTPIAPVKQTLDEGGGPKGGSWDAMRNAPYPLPPDPQLSHEGTMRFCFQGLHDGRGETTTGWEVIGRRYGKQTLLASIHHSFPEHDSRETVKSNMSKAREMLAAGTFHTTHRKWWHDYYPQSFLTINDPEKEAFYWIQMYKFASATRSNGPVMDLMGPWYHKTFWPMVWGDLNVELQYWTHLTANRLAVGESLPNSIDKHAENLSKNVPERWQVGRWKDSYQEQLVTRVPGWSRPGHQLHYRAVALGLPDTCRHQQ